MTCWVAIEGPCCAGKTTLAEGLQEVIRPSGLLVVPDYADFLGGGDNMPDPADARPESQLAALKFLLQTEEARFAGVPHSGALPVFGIQDRSALTLIGHCAGLDRSVAISGPLERLGTEIVTNDPRAVLPEYVIYLRASHGVQLSRNQGKFRSGSIFLDEQFNAGFEAFFSRRASMIPGVRGLTYIDGDKQREEVLEEAVAFLDKLPLEWRAV